MSELILFDIDGTLFDPEKFGRLIRAEFTKILNVEGEELIRVNADYYAKLETTTDFNPREIVSYVSGIFKVDRGPLDQVFWGNDDIYKQSFYPDVNETLKKLSENHTLGIFSQGNEELQNRKIDAGNIRKHLDQNHIYIHARKLVDEILAELPRGATVVDNNHDVVLKMASFSDAVWINRKTEDSDPNVRTIHTLSELTIDN